MKKERVLRASETREGTNFRIKWKGVQDTKIPGKQNTCFQYAHLQSLPNKTYVMAGEKFGNCGRDGYSNAPSHLHFELLNSSGSKIEFSKIAGISLSPLPDIDRENAKLFQGNKTPILLPCHCHRWSAENCLKKET